MAKFILGGIVTNIAGSVGGTTLRRVPNGFSMYNKAKGTSQARLLLNPRVPQIANIFQRWASLTDTERAGWNAQALLVTFPDKFGVAKNLTGRQLFSKANIQLLPDNSTVNDSTGFTTTTPDYTLDGIVMNVDDGILTATVSPLAGAVTLLFSVEISNKQIYQPVFKSRKVILSTVASVAPEVVNLEPFILANFPYLAVGMWIVVYVQAINEFGMVSPYQYAIQKAT
jgi:hypothetical protein